jgi:hypothetical protein
VTDNDLVPARGVLWVVVLAFAVYLIASVVAGIVWWVVQR